MRHAPQPPAPLVPCCFRLQGVKIGKGQSCPVSDGDQVSLSIIVQPGASGAAATQPQGVL
jgi:hypothetical protein